MERRIIMNFKQYKDSILNEALDVEKSINVDDAINWILNLNIPKRKPINVNKIDHSVLISLSDLASKIKNLNNPVEIKFQNKIFKSKFENQLRLSKQEIESVYKNSKENVIKKDIGKYIKFDASSYDKFLKNINTIEKFLKTLKGFHKKVIKDVVIKFVSSNEIKSKAKYKTNEDELWINVSKMGDTKDGYGSLLYVVLHELGHRYLKYNKQKWNIDLPEWITTKYSKVDSWSGEEKFAELFAMSHWKNKYKEYEDKLNKFNKIIN